MLSSIGPFRRSSTTRRDSHVATDGSSEAGHIPIHHAGFLDVVERIGNKVPAPIVLFLIVIAIVILLSHVLDMAGVSMTYLVIDPATNAVAPTTTAVLSLLRADGIRFMVERMIPIFLGFTALGQLFVAMLGVGVAELAGLVDAMIRKVVKVAPRWALCYILVFVGILSSIASNAG